MSLMAVFTCSLAAEMKTSPVLLSATSVLGAAAGGLTPIAPTGILGLSLAEEQGITGIEFPYAANMVMAMTVYFIVIYIVLKGYRLKSAVDLSVKEKISFNTQQKITLAGIAVLVVTVIFMGFDVGLMLSLIHIYWCCRPESRPSRSWWCRFSSRSRAYLTRRSS